MNCNQFAVKLNKCRTYAEAQPILEAMNLGPAAHELARTAFSLGANQEQYRNNFLASIVQEAKMKEEEEEGHGKKMHEEEEEEKKRLHEEEEEEKKRIHEYEGGEGHISGDPGMEHLTRTDKQTTDGSEPNTGFNNPENQMKEALRRAGVPEVAISRVLKEMDKSAPTTKQMIETINSAVDRAMKPVIKELMNHRQAFAAVDKKIKEIQSKSSSQSYAIEMPKSGKVQEMESMPINSMFPTPQRRQSLEDTRNEMRELDNAMNNGIIKSSMTPLN